MQERRKALLHENRFRFFGTACARKDANGPPPITRAWSISNLALPKWMIVCSWKQG